MNIIDVMNLNPSKTLEIEIALFGECCNKCDFCFQNKTKQLRASYESIIKSLNTLKNTLYSRHHGYKRIEIKLFGGELFFFTGEKREEILRGYKDFILGLKEIQDNIDKKISVQYTTNLLFNDLSMLIETAEFTRSNCLKCEVGTSFDVVGRFQSEKDLDLWYNNVIKLEPDDITSIYHKKTINAFLKSKNERTELENKAIKIFDDLYKRGFNFQFTPYLPNQEKFEDWLPNNQEIIDFYKFMINNYPKVKPISGLIQRNSCRGCSGCSLRIINSELKPHCRDGIYLSDPKLFKTKYNNSNIDELIKNYINSRGCLLCKYYSVCPFECFNQFDFVAVSSECWLKEIFNYLESINENKH